MNENNTMMTDTLLLPGIDLRLCHHSHSIEFVVKSVKDVKSVKSGGGKIQAE